LVLYETLCVIRAMEFCLWDLFRLSCVLHSCEIALCSFCQSEAVRERFGYCYVFFVSLDPSFFSYTSSLNVFVIRIWNEVILWELVKKIMSYFKLLFPLLTTWKWIKKRMFENLRSSSCFFHSFLPSIIMLWWHMLLR